MKQVVLWLSLFLLLSNSALSQVISGKVSDAKNQVLSGVNVFVKGSYDGATTDSSGVFKFKTKATGKVTLAAQVIGYEIAEKEIDLTGDLSIDFKLSESVRSLNAVTISAGAFEASDEKKNVIFKPFDIATTAGSNADIYGALQVLPGVQQVGESNGLYVRGGDASETNTYIDGLLVQHPFLGSVSDVAQRGRFSPFLFKGTSFSTGGYSTQFGQALSSVLNLTQTDLPEESATQVQLMSAGLGVVNTRRWKTASLLTDISYLNMKPTLMVVPQNREWTKPMEQGNVLVNYKYNIPEKGSFKLLTNTSLQTLGIKGFTPETFAYDTDTDLKSNYHYSNLTYTSSLENNWVLRAGAAYNFQNESVQLNEDIAIQKENLTHTKISITGGLGKRNSLIAGAEHIYSGLTQSWNGEGRNINENFSALFVETESYLSAKFAIRCGLRLENSQQLQEFNLAPRAAVAYKITGNNQVSISYGQFYQTPNQEFLFQPNLRFQKAEHGILNYQWQKNERLFRAEAYLKRYQKLLQIQEADFTNNGYGYARGIDLFFRDKATIKRGDLWLTYSYINAKRKYLTYPSLAQPAFVADHTASLVYKQFISSIKTYAGITYRFASGRPYFNPNSPIFLSDRTGNYHNLSFTASYLTALWGQSSVVYFSCTNIANFKNVFSYHYSSDGNFRMPVLAASDRSIFLALFITIK